VNTKAIELERWQLFLDEFSRIHDGWTVDLEIQNPDFGPQKEIQGRALRGLTWEKRARRITILASDTEGNHVGHVIDYPTRVWLETNDEGNDQALAIESRDGTIALLTFRWVPYPELVGAGVE